MNARLIARLDIKGPNLIKGVHLEGLKIVGDPREYAERYYREGIDELIYMDIVASLYGRNNLTDIVRYTARNIFVPLTVGGGIRSEEDAFALLNAGADKIALNTEATKNPGLITDLAHRFGSQAVVVSIEAKRINDGHWEPYTDNGRERTSMDAVEWAVECAQRGAGEILLTSIDQEGTRQGYDVSLVKEISERVSIPVIASGGMGTTDHLKQVLVDGGADAAAIADVLHFKRLEISEIRRAALEAGLVQRSA